MEMKKCRKCGGTQFTIAKDYIMCDSCKTKYRPASQNAGEAKSYTPEQLLSLSLKAWEQGQYDQANKIANRLLKANPENSLAWLVKGICGWFISKQGAEDFKLHSRCILNWCVKADDVQMHRYGAKAVSSLLAMAQQAQDNLKELFSQGVNEENAADYIEKSEKLSKEAAAIVKKTNVQVELNVFFENIATSMNQAVVDCWQESASAFSQITDAQELNSAYYELKRTAVCLIAILKSAVKLSGEEKEGNEIRLENISAIKKYILSLKDTFEKERPAKAQETTEAEAEHKAQKPAGSVKEAVEPHAENNQAAFSAEDEEEPEDDFSMEPYEVSEDSFAKEAKNQGKADKAKKHLWGKKEKSSKTKSDHDEDDEKDGDQDNQDDQDDFLDIPTAAVDVSEEEDDKLSIDNMSEKSQLKNRLKEIEETIAKINQKVHKAEAHPKKLEIEARIEELENQLDSLGLFKGKQKRALYDELDEADEKLEQIEEKIDDYTSKFKEEITKLREEAAKINIKLMEL